MAVIPTAKPRKARERSQWYSGQILSIIRRNGGDADSKPRKARERSQRYSGKTLAIIRRSGSDADREALEKRANEANGILGRLYQLSGGCVEDG
jgi:hypothetical protein